MTTELSAVPDASQRLDALLPTRTEMLTRAPQQQEDPVGYATWLGEFTTLLSELLPAFGATIGRCAGHLMSERNPNDWGMCRYRNTNPAYGLCARHLEEWVRLCDWLPVYQSRAQRHADARALAARFTEAGLPGRATNDGIELELAIAQQTLGALAVYQETLLAVLDAVDTWWATPNRAVTITPQASELRAAADTARLTTGLLREERA